MFPDEDPDVMETAMVAAGKVTVEQILHLIKDTRI